MPLSGKIAMVTGAARGIGRAIALVLAEKGANLGLADNHWEKFSGEKYYSLPQRISDQQEDVPTYEVIKSKGRETVVVEMDVSDHDQVKQGLNSISEKLGNIDILVNNAGIVANLALLDKMDITSWDREVRVNLYGAFYCIREVVPSMISKGWGRIINISSGSAYGANMQGAYAASKAGLLGLTKTVTIEYARYGITCNAILPGLIETPLVKAMPSEIKERAIRQIPSKRLGKEEEIAHVVAFLASNEASYVNGVEIHVSGGMHLSTLSLGSRKDR
ncbi:MAG: SDR family oxidoreductase [Candidatus Tectomicrobia bacterium]|uniref:SDR family oxidoreductase n=1 Tax=Tectimicrobiota bacterium TaxID=2528274 RepID=A0A933GMK0_UNCTE|nr:SDR family oxidoreductase [Candidatus Tectomicrobia bacterium]